jgi:Abnormal spindle-like microcephaly-assoc'd, ASPM-SPD-2-Hydin
MRIAHPRAGASMKLAAAMILAIAAVLMSAAGAQAAGGVDVLTPALGFGRSVVGATTTTTKDIELYNGTSSVLQLTAMQLTGAVFDFVPSFANGTTCPTPGAGASAGVGPGATCVVTVTFAPKTFGPLSGSLDMTFCAVDATPCAPITTSDVSLAGEGVHADTLTLAPTALSFTSTPLGTSSRTQTVTLTNGSEQMSITGLSLGGTAPHDFVIEHDGCTGADLAPGATCTFDVSFAPGQAGARIATVTVAGATVGNSYPTLTLSGIATAPPGGPVAPTGPTPPTVPAAPTVPATPNSPAHRTETARPGVSIELITCKPTGKATRHKPQCTSKLISRPLTFTATATTARATISRGRVVYATGSATVVGPGRWELVLHKRRALRAGVYTLTLGTRHGARHLSLRIA